MSGRNTKYRKPIVYKDDNKIEQFMIALQKFSKDIIGR